METFSDNMQLIGLELFDAAFAVPPGTEDDVKRRFMTLFVHESGRRRGGSAEVLRASNMLGESFALKRLHLDKRDAGTTPQGTPVRKELRHSASSGSDTFGTPDYVTQGHMAAFYEEYRVHLALSGLRGFPHLYGFGLSQGDPVIVMEWVEGCSLHEATTDLDGLLPLQTVARLGTCILELLLRARELDADFVHRDLSPRNIMLRTDQTPAPQQLASGQFDLCLIDFGSSTLRETGSDDPTFTASSDIWRMGTPAYAPPEMLTSDIALCEELRQSPTIDTYALCGILYQLYAGALPFDTSKGAPLSPYRTKTETQPTHLTPRFPDGGTLAESIMAGLSPQQEDRPTLEQLLAALRNWLEAPETRPTRRRSGARPVDEGYWQPGHARRQVTRRRLLSAAIVAGGALAAASIAFPRFARGRRAALDASRYARTDQPYEGEPLFRARDGGAGGWMLCTAAGAIACQPDSSRPIGALREGLAALYDDISQLYGFVAPVVETQSYAWVLPPAFAQVGHFSEGVAAAQDPDSRLWGLVDSHGSWVVPARFGAIRPRSQGACAACDATSLLWGAIDEQGSWTIEPRFAALGSRDADGRCVAQDASGAWGIVDDDGSWKVAPRFSQLRRLSHGLAPALEQEGGLWGFVDGEGQWRVEPRYADARPLYAPETGGEGCLAAVQDAQTRLWLFVDADGEPEGGMRPSLWKLGDLHDGLAPAQATWHDDVVSFGEADDDHVEGVGARYGYVDATGAWQMRQQATLVDTGIEAAEI